jgi:hypothetical protein
MDRQELRWMALRYKLALDRKDGPAFSAHVGRLDKSDCLRRRRLVGSMVGASGLAVHHLVQGHGKKDDAAEKATLVMSAFHPLRTLL